MNVQTPVITPVAIEQVLKDFILADPRVSEGGFRLGDSWAGEGREEDRYPLILWELPSSRLSKSQEDWNMIYSLRLYAFAQRREDASNTTSNFAFTSSILTDFLIRLVNSEDLYDAGWIFPSRDFNFSYVPVGEDRDGLTVVSVSFDVATPVLPCVAAMPVNE